MSDPPGSKPHVPSSPLRTSHQHRPCWSCGPGLTAGEGRPRTPQLDALGNKPPHRPAVLSWGEGGVSYRSCGDIEVLVPVPGGHETVPSRLEHLTAMAGGAQGPPCASCWGLRGKGATGSVHRDLLRSRGSFEVEAHLGGWHSRADTAQRLGSTVPWSGSREGHGVGTAGKCQMPAGAWAAEDAGSRKPLKRGHGRWAGAGGRQTRRYLWCKR